jgi:putative resolvase
MKLSQYAKNLGIHYRTAWNMFNNNQIPNAYKLPTGTIIVPNQTVISDQSQNKITKVCLYSRVCSSQNKNNLISQEKRLTEFCNAKGWTISKSIKEIGSGINDNRKQLNDILKNHEKYDYIVVEHKDRLTRLGFNYFNQLLPNKIFVINETEDKTDDLTGDLVAIITSFCARLYGQRRGKRKTELLIKELNNNET